MPLICSRKAIKSNLFVKRYVMLDLRPFLSANCLYTQAADHFPDLHQFSNYWPIRDLIKSHLKYTSSQAKRRSKSRERDEGSGDEAAKGKVGHAKGKRKAHN
jgi:hypothetical protein